MLSGVAEVPVQDVGCACFVMVWSFNVLKATAATTLAWKTSCTSKEPLATAMP